RRRRKRFERPLQNPLRANVDPASRRHLPVHHQSRTVQLMKAVPVIPVPHQIRIAQQHSRRVFMRPENPHWLPRLHQQRFIRFQRLQRPHHGMETLPISSRLPRPAVHHQIFRLFRHLRIDVVQEHPQRRPLLPSLARNRRPPRRAKRPPSQSRVRGCPRHRHSHQFQSPPLRLTQPTPFYTPLPPTLSSAVGCPL